jgi:hypothetical protein
MVNAGTRGSDYGIIILKQMYKMPGGIFSIPFIA